MQIVCIISPTMPLRGRIIEANVGTPGASGDSTIWQRQPLCRALSQAYDAKNSITDLWIPVKGFLVCDQAYRHRVYQMQPFAECDVLSEDIQLYNTVQRKARRIVECVFGVIKKQFKILNHACEQSPNRKTSMVWAILILHNIMLRERCPWLDDDGLPIDLASYIPPDNSWMDDLRDLEDVEIDEDDALQRGYQRRRDIVAELWSS